MHNVQRSTSGRDEQAAAQRSVDRAFPAVAEFLASGDARQAAIADGAQELAAAVRTSTDPRAALDHVLANLPAYIDEAREHTEAITAYRQVFEAQQTHVIKLLDEPGATLTVTCPDWCESDHAEDETHGTFLVDLAHRGAEEALHVDLGDGDHEDVLLCEITQYPFGRDMREPTALLWPTLGMTEAALDPDKLCALAGQLREYAEALDEQAARLERIRGAQ